MAEFHKFSDIDLGAYKGDECYFKFIETVNKNRPFYSEKTTDMMEKALNYPEFTKYFGHNSSAIAEALKVNPSAITRLHQPSFIVSPKVFRELCHNILRCSCQEILFNDKNGISVLPQRIGSAARAMEDLMLHERKEILSQIEEIRNQYEKENGPYQIHFMKIPWLQVQEYAANMYRPITDCIGDYGGWRVATSICKLKKFNETTRIGAHLDTLMFLSWAMGTTIDALMVQDYTKVTDIGYRYANRVVKITDSSTVKMVGHILNLPTDIQAKCIALVFKACSKNE